LIKLFVKIIPEENKIVGYTTRNSGGVPSNFKNYFVIIFDKSFSYFATVKDGKIVKGERNLQGTMPEPLSVSQRQTTSRYLRVWRLLLSAKNKR